MNTSQDGCDETIGQRRSRLLQHAFDVPEAQRTHWIRVTCADDAQLQRELLGLVKADARAHRLLDASATDIAANWVIEEDAGHVGHIVGTYRLIKLLGEGGMGRVWEAERVDRAFVSTVALKMLKPGMDSAARRSRFQRERELLARLAHPHIARLYDAGVSATGQAYFVMERIDGVPLNEFLRTQRLALRERLQLFVRLCQAIAHAHSQLVIHRDVKPSNILVRADGWPSLVDFGIAKSLDVQDAHITQTHQHFLTPAYAAPEQWRGEPASTVTDIYSLGAVFFELLSNCAYHLGGKGRDSAQLPRSGEVFIARHLRGDLDTIAAKALAAEPAERYSTAQALADDVQRVLDGRPVLARAESGLYRAAKFARRNPLAATLAACLAIVGSVLIGAACHGHLQALQGAARAAGMREIAIAGLARSNAAAPDYHGARSVLPLLMDEQATIRGDAARLRARAYLALSDGFTQLGQHEQAYRNAALAVESLQAAAAPAAQDDPVALELSGLSAATQAAADENSAPLSMAQWLSRRATVEGCATP